MVSDERLSTIDAAADQWLSSHAELAAHATHHSQTIDLFRQTGESMQDRRLLWRNSMDDDDEIYHPPLAYTALAGRRRGLGQATITVPLSSEAREQLEAIRQRLGAKSRSKALRQVLEEAFSAEDEKRITDGEPPIDLHESHSEADFVADEFAGFRPIHIDTSRLRIPSERIGSDALAPDASNLATVLAGLPPPVLGAICADLISLVPGISTLKIVPEDDAFRIDFELSGGERIPARLVSDGTLRILALLAALCIQPRPTVLGIEEPENGIYPGRLRKLLEYLQSSPQERADDSTLSTQLIITTHSPVILAALYAHPERLRFIDLVRRNGELVSRARIVGSHTVADRGRSTVTLREIGELLHAADSELQP